MQVFIQYKIKQNPIYRQFLNENSYWYKYLNRNPLYFKDFEKDLKKKYRLTTEDRLNKMADSLDTISKIMSILN